MRKKSKTLASGHLDKIIFFIFKIDITNNVTLKITRGIATDGNDTNIQRCYPVTLQLV